MFSFIIFIVSLIGILSVSIILDMRYQSKTKSQSPEVVSVTFSENPPVTPESSSVSEIIPEPEPVKEVINIIPPVKEVVPPVKEVVPQIEEVVPVEVVSPQVEEVVLEPSGTDTIVPITETTSVSYTQQPEVVPSESVEEKPKVNKKKKYYSNNKMKKNS